MPKRRQDPSGHDAKGFVQDWLDWSGRPLRQIAETYLELVGNRDLIPYLGSPSINALRHSFPYAPSNLLRRAGPILRDAKSTSTWHIFTANLWMRLFSDDEFVRVGGGNKDDNPRIVTQHKAIMRQFHLPGHQHELYKALGDVGVIGFGWLENPIAPYREMRYGPSSRELAEGVSEMDFTARMVERLEPCWFHLHPLDVYPDWSRPLGWQMTGAVVSDRMGGDEFEAFIDGIEEAQGSSEGINRKGLEQALGRNSGDAAKQFHFKSGSPGERWRDLTMRALSEEDISLPDRFRPLQFYRYRGEVPWEPLGSLERYRLIIVANDEWIVDVPQPYYPHPFRCLQLGPQTGRLHSMSPLEALRYEQDELDTWRMLRTRAGIKTINAPTIVDSAAFDDPSQFEEPASDQIILARPGVNGALAAQQMQHNYAPIYTVGQMIMQQQSWADQASGLPDLIRGIAAGARTTKREIDELSVTGNLPLDVRVDLLENEDLPALARDVPQRLILALRDLRHPKTGMPTYDAELQDRLGWDGAKLEHLAEDASIIFQGSARFQARGAFAGIVQMVTSILTAFPGMAPFINVPQLATDMLAAASPDAQIRYLNDVTKAIGQAATQQALAPQGGAAGPGVASPPRIRMVQ